jgi:hypothetical protein
VTANGAATAGVGFLNSSAVVFKFISDNIGAMIGRRNFRRRDARRRFAKVVDNVIQIVRVTLLGLMTS